MTLFKLLAGHQEVHGRLTCKSLRDMERVSPLLLAFVRDGSIFFALSVTTLLPHGSLSLTINSYAIDHLASISYGSAPPISFYN